MGGGDVRRQSPVNIDRPFTEMRKLKSSKNSFFNTKGNNNNVSRVISQAHNPNRRVNSMATN